MKRVKKFFQDRIKVILSILFLACFFVNLFMIFINVSDEDFVNLEHVVYDLYENPPTNIIEIPEGCKYQVKIDASSITVMQKFPYGVVEGKIKNGELVITREVYSIFKRIWCSFFLALLEVIAILIAIYVISFLYILIFR